MRTTIMLLFLTACSLSFATPPAPLDASHPGSLSYDLNFEIIEENFMGRKSFLFLPEQKRNELSAVIVFGHGQAIGLKGYDATLEHLAKKGIAAIFVKYDKGFFDRKWRRMADDFNAITQNFLEKYSHRLDPKRLIYSGHSLSLIHI